MKITKYVIVDEQNWKKNSVKIDLMARCRNIGPKIRKNPQIKKRITDQKSSKFKICRY